MKKNDPALASPKPPCQAGNYLTIRTIESSPSLARHLPADLARQYQAIPIAADLLSVTVAMANPADQAAWEAIRAAVQFPVTVVKGDEDTIAALIANYYPGADSHTLRLLAWSLEESFSPDQQYYLDYLARTLNSRIAWKEGPPHPARGKPPLWDPVDPSETDLLICNVPPLSCLQNLARFPGENKLLQHCSASILSLKIPRWPIRQILLILQDDPSDHVAVDWAIHLARACLASLIILPVVPPPPIYTFGTRDELPELLKSNCDLGHHLRQIAHRLSSWEVPGTFKLRNEAPEWQIRSEISEGDFDLIIIGFEQQTLLEKIVLQDLVNPLMYWTTIPVLLAQNYPQGK